MGAGSAKGMTEDGDADSISSEIKAQPATHYFGKLPKSNANFPGPNIQNNNNLVLQETSASMEENLNTAVALQEESQKDQEPKKKSSTLFGFSKTKDDQTNAFEEEEKTKDSKGFKIFYWKRESKKQEPKDERLEEEIKDLQRTFDSLGIVGKSLWNEKGKSNPSKSADDIRSLEPMRNRTGLKGKNHRANSLQQGSFKIKTGDNMGSSVGSIKRSFKYSWETDAASSSLKSEDWKEFQPTSIEGFDPEKFKKINQKSVIDTTSSLHLPHSVMDNSPPPRSPSVKSSPLSYDQKERELLASIEREYLAA